MNSEKSRLRFKVRMLKSRVGVFLILAMGFLVSGSVSHSQVERLPPSSKADKFSRTFFGWNAGWTNLDLKNPSCGASLVATSSDRADVFTCQWTKSDQPNYPPNIYQRSLVRGVWGGWQDLGQLPSLPNSELTTVAFRDGWIGFFVGLADGTVTYKYWDGSRWSGWNSLGGDVGNPVVAVDGDTIYVFARGKNRELMYANGRGTPGTWSSWMSLGGKLQDWGSRIAAASSKPGRMDVVALWEDKSAYHKATTPITSGGNLQLGDRSLGPMGWTSWQPLGGKLYTLTMTSWGPNRLDVFGWGEDHAVHHKYLNGGSWSSGWANLGGDVVTRPIAVALEPNVLELFVQGTDYGLYQKEWNGSSWNEWAKIADCFSGSLSVVSSGARHMDLVLFTSELLTSKPTEMWHNSFGIRPSTAAGPKPPACPCGQEGQKCCARQSCAPGLECDSTNVAGQPPADYTCKRPPTPTPTPTPAPPPPPPPPPPQSAPTISVSSEGSGTGSVFTVTGSGFNSASTVTIRIFYIDPVYGTPADQYFQQSSNSSGQLSFRTAFPCITGQQLRFTATDGRPDPNSTPRGSLWSNTFVTSCP